MARLQSGKVLEPFDREASHVLLEGSVIACHGRDHTLGVQTMTVDMLHYRISNFLFGFGRLFGRVHDIYSIRVLGAFWLVPKGHRKLLKMQFFAP